MEPQPNGIYGGDVPEDTCYDWAEAHERDDRADPVHKLHAELYEQAEEGDEDDIHGGNKAGFSDRRVDDAVLLDDAGRAQKKAADHAAQKLPLCRHSGRADGDSLFVAQEDDRYKHKAGEKVSCRLRSSSEGVAWMLSPRISLRR